jgi:CRP-like cAMP-binding protein
MMFVWESLKTHNQIDSLAFMVTVLTYRGQEIIFEEGEPGSSAYIIISGSIECES